MSKRYGLIIGSPEWVKVKEEEDTMEKKDSVLERFRKRFVKPTGYKVNANVEDIHEFIQSEITKAKEEERKTIKKFIENYMEDIKLSEMPIMFKRSKNLALRVVLNTIKDSLK